MVFLDIGDELFADGAAQIPRLGGIRRSRQNAYLHGVFRRGGHLDGLTQRPADYFYSAEISLNWRVLRLVGRAVKARDILHQLLLGSLSNGVLSSMRRINWFHYFLTFLGAGLLPIACSKTFTLPPTAIH